MIVRKSDLIAVASVLLFAFLFSAPYAFAAPLTPKQAGDIYAVAYGQCPLIAGHSNGCPVEWLAKPPSVNVVSEHGLCVLADVTPPCSVRGLFDSGQVYVSDKLDFSTAYGASVLLHEYVHYLQWLSRKGETITSCRQWLFLELEAYMIQAHVLKQAGDAMSAYAVLFAARQLRCSE